MNFLISFSAQYLILVILLITVSITWLSVKNLRNESILLAILSLAIAFLLAYLADKLYYDHRPFVINHTNPLFPHPPDNGFPSDHTLLAWVIAGVIFIRHYRWGILLGLLAIILGICRVLAGIHHPVDIVASIGIASLSVGISWLVLRKAEERTSNRFLVNMVTFSQKQDRKRQKQPINILLILRIR